jgi:hypothetical protein
MNVCKKERELEGGTRASAAAILFNLDCLTVCGTG